MVMSVIVTMPVFMCSRFVMVQMVVLFEEQQRQRDSNNQRCNHLSGVNGFSQENRSKDDSKKRGTGENDLTTGGAKSLGRSYIEH